MEIKSQTSINKGRSHPSYILPTILSVKDKFIEDVVIFLWQKLRYSLSLSLPPPMCVFLRTHTHVWTQIRICAFHK